MKRTSFGLVIIFILLTTYRPNLEFLNSENINIKIIKIENNEILEDKKIKENLNYLYRENLFFLNYEEVQKHLKSHSFIESFTIKKVYPSTLKINIIEKTPIAVLHNQKKKFYISDKGSLINYIKIKKFENLPNVFGSGRNFIELHKNLEKINFPFEVIKSFYFFDSGRWDIILKDEKIIKLPINNYLLSLKNFMQFKLNNDFDKYKVFDYRIKDQLILN